MSPAEKMADKMLEFVTDSVIGVEKKLYEGIQGFTPARLPYIPPNQDLVLIICKMCEEYWNLTYMAIVEPTRDPEMAAKFAVLTNLMDHSPVCLVNILAHTAIMMHLELDRAQLDMASSAKYEACVRSMVTARLDSTMHALISRQLSHSCTGPKVDLPMPEDEMFFHFKLNSK